MRRNVDWSTQYHSVPLSIILRDIFYERRYKRNVFMKYFVKLPDEFRVLPDVRLVACK